MPTNALAVDNELVATRFNVLSARLTLAKVSSELLMQDSVDITMLNQIAMASHSLTMAEAHIEEARTKTLSLWKSFPRFIRKIYTK